MYQRQILALVIVCAGLTLGTMPAAYGDAPEAYPTASELFDQGMQRYEAGDLTAARNAFRRVDPMQLPKGDRVALYRTLQEIDRRLNPAADGDAAAAATAQPTGPTAAELLARADDVAANDPARAAALYRQVMTSDQAGESLKLVAQARLAQAERTANAELTDVRRQLDLANADLEAGDIDAAQERLDMVRQSGESLGWFDQQRLERLSASVQERRRAQAATAETAPAAEAAVAQADAAAAAEVAEQAEPMEAQTVEEAQQTQRETAAAAGQAEAATQAGANGDLLETVRILRAKQLAAEGREAELRGEFRLAEQRYAEALRLAPEIEGVQDALNALRARRNQAFTATTPAQTLAEELNIRRQAVIADFNRYLSTAESEAQRGDYGRAIEAVTRAQVLLDDNSTLLGDTYAQLNQRADTLNARILREQLQAQRLQLEREEQAQAEEIRKSEKLASEQRVEEVNRLLLRARDLQRDQQYEEALQLVEQALFLEPTNLAAQMMRDVLNDGRLFVRQRDAERIRAIKVVEQGLLNIEATTPYSDLITYPADWPQLSMTRLEGLDLTGGESEANRRTMQLLREPVPINFEANRLVNVLDYLRNTTGANFFINWPVLESVGVEQDTPITLQLTNVPAEQALRLVLQQAGAGAEFDPIGYSIIEGIVNISTVRDLQRTTDLRPYDIRDLLVQVPNFTNAPEFDLTEALSNTNSGGGGSGGRGGGGEGLFGDDDEDEDDEQPTRQELIDQIIQLIQDTVGDPLEWADAGGDVSSIRELNGQLIVKTTADNHRQIAGLLAQLRETRAVQISVEARFLLVEEHFLEEIGFDLDINWADPGGNFGPIAIGQDSINIARRGTTDLTPDSFLRDETDADAPGPFIPGTGFASTGRALDLGITYLDDLELNLIIQATQANQKSLALTAPRVTFFNGQRAYVLVVRQIAFVSDLEPVPDAFGFDVTISVVQAGVVLDVEGTISADRRYVTLTLRPSLASTQTPFAEFPVIGTIENEDDDDGGGLIGFFEGNIQLPELELTEVRATVSVPDKGTILLGGQRLVAETEIESGVPVLSKVPLINRFFTNNSTVQDSRTLLILVRPTIIIQSEEEENLFPGLSQDIAQFNIGR